MVTYPRPKLADSACFMTCSIERIRLRNLLAVLAIWLTVPLTGSQFLQAEFPCAVCASNACNETPCDELSEASFPSDDSCDAEACDAAVSNTPKSAFFADGSYDWSRKDAHAGLNYDNDFSYLDDPADNTRLLGDSLKRLFKQGDNWVEVGGFARLRFHDERNLGRQEGTTILDEGTSNPLLLQVRPYANWHLNDSIRIFAEGLYADVVAETEGYQPRGNERNRGDFLNLFIDIQLTDEALFRLGRQQLRYGSRRLIAGPGWANTSRNHDGAKLIVKGEGYQHDILYMNTVGVQVDEIDDITDDRRLFGCWSTFKQDDRLAEAYYIGYDDQRAGRERILHHIGGRVKGGTDCLYEMEAIAQFGRQSALGLDHLAGMFVAGLGKKLADIPWTPTLWLYFDLATGDNGGGRFNRYDRIYDRAHHELGLIDTVQRGNVEVYSLQGTLAPCNRLGLFFRYYRVFAHREEDNVAALGNVVIPQRFDTDDYGDIVDFAARFKVTPRSDARLGYSYFDPGSKPISQNSATLLYLEWNVWF